MPGRVVHFEVHAEDPERAAAFYSRVFGWEIRKWEGPVDYWLVSTGAEQEPGIDGAILRRMGAAPGGDPAISAFVNTIEVDSIERVEREIPAAGGEQVVPRQELAGVGRVSYFRDTEGNVFGALEPEPGS